MHTVQKGTLRHWLPPVPGTLKNNTDASFIKDSGQSRVGIVARDHTGTVALSICRQIHQCRDAEETEAVAIQVGLSELVKVYRGPACVETDYATVAALIQLEAGNKSSLFPLIADIKHLLSSFQAASIIATSRDMNTLAHELAAYARSHGDVVLLAGVPTSLQSIWANDCNLEKVVACSKKGM